MIIDQPAVTAESRSFALYAEALQFAPSDTQNVCGLARVEIGALQRLPLSILGESGIAKQPLSTPIRH
jgi:hypothetical protein